MAATANLGLLQLHLGKIDEADKHLTAALKLARRFSVSQISPLDSYVQLQLIRGQLGRCQALFDDIDTLVSIHESSILSWQQLAVSPTRLRFLLASQRWNDAGTLSAEAIKVADKKADRSHQVSLRVLGADALLELGRLQEAADLLEQAGELAVDVPVAVYAEVERARAALIARTTGRAQARRPFERALRLLAAVGGVSARMDAAFSYKRSMRPVDEKLRRQLDATPHDLNLLVDDTLPAKMPKPRPEKRTTANLEAPGVSDLVPLLHLTSKPALLAREAFVLLRESGCTKSLAVLNKDGHRVLDVTAHEGWTADQAARAAEATDGVVGIPVGTTRGLQLHLVVEPRDDIQSRAFVSNVKSFISSARALEVFREEERARSALSPPDVVATHEDGVFASDNMVRLLGIAKQAATSNTPILITGETGTGKEVLARIIHKYSSRSSRDFLPFNCSSVPSEMVDSQLFGHRRGAFTGAREDAPGVIRAASKGTLLLDEIGELDLRVQPKLLRFLESKEVHPLGEPRPVNVDVRVIAATNANIDQLVRDGRFREDLFYRLNIIRLDVPPLRERREEIPPLVYHFLRRYGSESGRPNLTVTDDALKCLLLYEWPGNVRRLANEVRRAVALAESDDPIDREQLSPEVVAATRAMATSVQVSGDGEPAELRVRVDQPLSTILAQVERDAIQQALAITDGHVSNAARLLGISRKGLFLKRRRLGIENLPA